MGAHLRASQKRDAASVLRGCRAKPVPSHTAGSALVRGHPYCREALLWAHVPGQTPLTSLAAIFPSTKWHQQHCPPSRGLEAGRGGRVTRWLPLDVSSLTMCKNDLRKSISPLGLLFLLWHRPVNSHPPLQSPEPPAGCHPGPVARHHVLTLLP